MRTIGLFIKPPGTTVSMKISAVSPQIVNYVVFGQSHRRDGKNPVATWHSRDLETTGRTLFLELVRGYDITLKAAIMAGALLTATLSFDGTALTPQVVDLPAEEGPVVARKWSIVVRQEGDHAKFTIALFSLFSSRPQATARASINTP